MAAAIAVGPFRHGLEPGHGSLGIAHLLRVDHRDQAPHPGRPGALAVGVEEGPAGGDCADLATDGVERDGRGGRDRPRRAARPCGTQPVRARVGCARRRR